MPKQNYHHGDLPSALLQAAEEELEEHGLEKFSLRAVAKRAGVSHAAPAHHFGGSQGLLTALAASGYERMVSWQNERQSKASDGARAQSIALGLGYIDFATTHPALFRLMFASEQPQREESNFEKASLMAFDKLVNATRATAKADPYSDPEAMKDLMASWAMVHGLAELIVTGRAERTLGLSALKPADRNALIEDILERVNATPQTPST